MEDQALVVFTNKSRERLLAEGGTSDWVVVPAHVKKLKYAVCTRNSHKAFEQEPEWSIGPEPHGSAFMVGRISDVEFTYRARGRNRYLVRFSEYADVPSTDKIRSPDRRNPVEYVPLDVLKARGLDIDTLDFKPMPPAPIEDQDEEAAEDEVCSSVLDQAKQMIADALGADPARIRITIEA